MAKLISDNVLKTAIEAARAAGKILIKNFGKVTADQIEEKTKGDFLSYVDRCSEQEIINCIRKRFPGHAILAEESGTVHAASDFLWIIDPLDGTRNYINGIPIFTVSIAMQKKGETMLGVVYDCMRDELFRAEKNGGAFLNDNALSVSDLKDMQKGLIATGFPFKNRETITAYMRCFESAFRNCNGIRRMGSAALDLAYVACGRVDGFWELGLQPWDMAAGALLIAEAGGRVTDFWGTDQFLENHCIVGGNRMIVEKLTKITSIYFDSSTTF